HKMKSLKLDSDLTTDSNCAMDRLARSRYNTLRRKNDTSCNTLKRSIKTAHYIMDGFDRLWVDMEKTYLLNERALGNLQGTQYDQMDEKNITADLLPPDNQHPKFNYLKSVSNIPPGLSESDADLQKRVKYCVTEYISPKLISGSNVLVVTHSGVMRVILEHFGIRAEIPPNESNEFANCDSVLSNYAFKENIHQITSEKHKIFFLFCEWSINNSFRLWHLLHKFAIVWNRNLSSFKKSQLKKS
ncbi:hypothetical protein GJ496_010250, partial [Pomphorhynchus laevis]